MWATCQNYCPHSLGVFCYMGCLGWEYKSSEEMGIIDHRFMGPVNDVGGKTLKSWISIGSYNFVELVALKELFCNW